MTNRIDIKFKQLKETRQTALISFLTAGFPDIKTSQELAQAILKSGSDMLELGIPFSDPLADGRTIQKTSFHALSQGVNITSSLGILKGLREEGVTSPIIFMGYYNPFLRYGTKKFIQDASSAGLDGIIVPDLPPEEASQFKQACNKKNIYLIPLLAPTSTDQRIAKACEQANGFIYCVSVTGVTGARKQLSAGLEEFVNRIRQHTDLPIVVGFGVSNPHHVDTISRFADGVIFASALLDIIDKAPRDQMLQEATNFVSTLRSSAKNRS